MNIELIDFWCNKELVYKRLIFLHKLLQATITATIFVITIVCSLFFEGILVGLLFNIVLIYLLIDSLRRANGLECLLGYIGIIKSHKGEM